jgi:hypothetical protein
MNKIKDLVFKHKNLIVLLVLSGFFVKTIIDIFTTQFYFKGVGYDRSFSIEHYIALFFLMTNLVLYFKARKYFKYGIIIMLVLGLFNVVNFNPEEQTMSFGTSSKSSTIEISFQQLSFLFILLYVAVNVKTLHKMLPEPSKETMVKSNTFTLNMQEENIAKFRGKFQDLSNEELEQKVNSPGFTDEAKEAARRILEERKG